MPHKCHGRLYTQLQTQKRQRVWCVMAGQIKYRHHLRVKLQFASPVSFLPLETTLHYISNNSSTESEWCWRGGLTTTCACILWKNPDSVSVWVMSLIFCVWLCLIWASPREKKLWETFAQRYSMQECHIECDLSNQVVDRGFDDCYGLTCNLGFSQPGQSLPPRLSTRSPPSAPGSSAQGSEVTHNLFQQWCNVLLSFFICYKEFLLKCLALEWQ